MWILTLCFQLCSILMRIHTLKIKFSPKSFTSMKVEIHLQNQLRSNGNLGRYVFVHLGKMIAALCDIITFMMFLLLFFFIEAALSSLPHSTCFPLLYIHSSCLSCRVWSTPCIWRSVVNCFAQLSTTIKTVKIQVWLDGESNKCISLSVSIVDLDSVLLFS